MQSECLTVRRAATLAGLLPLNACMPGLALLRLACCNSSAGMSCPNTVLQTSLPKRDTGRGLQLSVPPR